MSSFDLAIAQGPKPAQTDAAHQPQTGAVAAPGGSARRLLALSRKAMAASAAVTLLAALLAYPLAHKLNLPAQILAHLAIPVAAGVFKLGYVARLAAQQAMAPAVPTL